ncbi:MAG TPA: ABC transporter permease [Flavobacteriales bacterium]|nr:ABC transporter permease [Flavobacteriales bacterium]
MSSGSVPFSPPSTRLRRAHGPLLFALAWKNVRLRYKSSFLGFLWTLLNPLLFLLIFLVIFRHAFPQVPNYPVFALSGLVFWAFFATSSAHILSALVENASILKSFPVPTLAFPLAQAMAGLINLLLSFVPFALVLVSFGWRPEWVHLLVFPITALFAAFLFGLSLALCALNVYFRDIGLLWGALLPAFFYLTPIAYPPELVPVNLRWIAAANPLYHFIGLVRSVIVDGTAPAPSAWLISTALSAVALGLGLWVHERLRRGYVANC